MSTTVGPRISVLDHGFVRLVGHMGGDVDIVRAARVSYDAAWRAGEDEGSDTKLLRYLIKNKHTSPFEAVEFQFEVKAPIFVLRQWHRHRTWCLSGDTMISFERPNRIRRGIRTAKTIRLDELYRKWQPTVRKERPQRQENALWPRSRIQKMLLRVYNERKKEFTIGHIKDITLSGVKHVFEIELADGKKLKCSKDHLLLTTNGWQRLEKAVGLVVRGKTTGMTREAIVLTNGYACGSVPWNKGVTGYKTNRKFTDAERAELSRMRSGSGSNFWKGGVSSDRAKIASWTTRMAPKVHAKFNYTCQAPGCGKRGGRLHAHHVKSVVGYPEFAFDFDNLETWCDSCHAIEHGKTGEIRHSKGATLCAMQSKIVSVRLVGEEPTFDISVAGQHHNFVANGIIVHNSYNELSARYRELPSEFYVPEASHIGKPSKDNKQGRDVNPASGDINEIWYFQVIHSIREACERSFKIYSDMIQAGVPRELARGVLPLNTYSHMFAKVDLHNLLHFLELRTHAHAQYEIRVYAEAILKLITPIVPITISAWNEKRVANALPAPSKTAS